MLAPILIATLLAQPVIVLRKLAGMLLMPSTLLWVALLLLVVRAWPERRWRWALVALFVGYTAAASPWTSYLLLRGLERPFERIDPDQGPAYDALLVLGGGTDAPPPERDRYGPQLGGSGDRVRLSAGLYLKGQTPVLVTSGSTVDGKRDISEETLAIWREWGVPPEAVIRLPHARNTVEEISAFDLLVDEHGWDRIGVVTSARHQRRALAICRRRGLACEPLPVDFRADRPSLDPFSVLPNGEALSDVESALWEYLGLIAVRLVGG